MPLSIRTVPKMIIIAVLVAAGAVSLAVRTAQAQVADCLNPRGMVQQIICQDAELSALSQEMRQALRVVIRSIPRTQRPRMLREQRDWSLSRNRCIRSQNAGECLRVIYEDRITALGARLAGDVGQPAPSPVEIAPRVFARPPAGPAQLPQPPPLANGAVAPLSPVERRPLPQLAARPTENIPQNPPAVEPLAPDTAPTLPQVARTTPDQPPPQSPSPATGKVADTLSSGVWRAEITSGIRPGTIYVFQRNGVLLTADCVQAYRLGSWNIASNGDIALTAPSGETRRGQIIQIRDRYVRMQIKNKSGAILRTLILRPASSAFDCSPNQG